MSRSPERITAAVDRFATRGWPAIAVADEQLQALCPVCRSASITLPMNGAGPAFSLASCPNACRNPTAELHAIYEPRRGDHLAPGWVGPPSDETVVSARLNADETDVGNAIRFVLDWRHEVRHVVPGVGWHIFDGRRWRRDDDGGTLRRAAKTAKLIADEATAIAGDPTDEDAAKRAKRRFAWALRSQQAQRLDAAVKLAGVDQRLLVDVADIDRDPWALNVGTGTLDLRTGEIRRHDAADQLTHLVGIAYDPDAQAPRWDRFLREIFPDDELRAWVQRAAGYTLTGDTSEQVLFAMLGDGANGKTTMLRVLAAALGDLAITADTQTFTTAGQNRAARSDLARLRGKRLVYASEIDSNAKLDERLVKTLTGGERITARFNRENEFEYEPVFKVWLAANHLPAIEGVDHAIWRRIRVIPCGQRFDRPDRHLAAKLLAELPGILAWAVRGCVAWQRDGLGTCDAVEHATERYRNSQDRIGQFLSAVCTRDPGSRITNLELHGAYVAWCDEHGYDAADERAFGRALTRHGIGTAKSNGQRVRTGIRLPTGGGR